MKFSIDSTACSGWPFGTFDKSGCCYHIAEEFIVVNNKPFKVRSVEEDAAPADDRGTKITTKTWKNGKWKTVVTHGKREE